MCSAAKHAHHIHIKAAPVSITVATIWYFFFLNDTVNFEYEVTVFDISVSWLDGGACISPSFIFAFAPSLFVDGSKFVAEEQVETAVLGTLFLSVVPIDLDEFNLSIERHLVGSNCFSCP